ncbi:Uncharacterised protein [Escherichia coli]|nr:Uncharacterised protein [Escherichia coli]
MTLYIAYLADSQKESWPFEFFCGTHIVDNGSNGNQNAKQNNSIADDL